MKFSILIPAYKSVFLEECIQSILDQTYNDFELIIVDDASPEDLQRIVGQYSDSRIRFYRNNVNCGAINVVDNWNTCLGYAQGDYVICMGDDDKLLPNCLEEYAQLIDKYPGIGLLHGWTEIIGEDSIPYELTTHRCERESAISLLWHRWNAYHLQFIGDFCFERKWLVSQGGFYKLPLAWASDDISAIIGASKNGVVNTQTVVFQYRRNRHTISNTGNSEIKMNALELEREWYDRFLKSHSYRRRTDSIYAKMISKELEYHFEKKKMTTIASNLKNTSRFRIVYWWFNRKDDRIRIKTLIGAFALSINKSV